MWAASRQQPSLILEREICPTIEPCCLYNKIKGFPNNVIQIQQLTSCISSVTNWNVIECTMWFFYSFTLVLLSWHVVYHVLLWNANFRHFFYGKTNFFKQFNTQATKIMGVIGASNMMLCFKKQKHVFLWITCITTNFFFF